MEVRKIEEKKIPKITESEWQIMELLWQQEEGMSQSQLMERLGGRWNRNTVHTFLSRLSEKGMVQIVRESNPYLYKSLVTRAECEQEERRNFLERVYQGSVGRMVASFVKDGGLTKEEADELRKMLDELR